MLSCVLIIPAALQIKANALAVLMGWGPSSYSVPLSATGAEPATHYGLHTWATPEFVGMLQGASQGQMPAELVEAGYPPSDFAAVIGGLIASVRPDLGGHFTAVLAANGLVLVAE